MAAGGGGDYVTPVPPRPPGGSSRLRWLGVIAGFAVLVGVVVLQRHSGNAPAAADPATTGTTSASTTPASTTPPPTRQPTPTPPTSTPPTSTSADTPTSTPTPTSPSTSGLATTVGTLSSLVPAMSAGWEIVGFSNAQGLVRINPTTGQLVRIPPMDGGTMQSLQSLVSVKGRSIVTGYGDNGPLATVFPDGGPASPGAGALRTAMEVLPGPDPSHLWVWDDHATATTSEQLKPTLILVDWHGIKARASITLPTYLGYASGLQPDGAGYVMMSGIGGTYDVRPGSITLITHGAVLAAGPTGYLVYECGDTPQCRSVVIDRSTGSRRIIPPVPISGGYFPGTGSITSDGTHAAYADTVNSPTESTTRLILVDLASGASRVVGPPMGPSTTTSGGYSFSPDGKQLAMVADGGDVGIVDVKTGSVRMLGVTSTAGYFLDTLTVRRG